MNSPFQNNPWLARALGQGGRYQISKCLSRGGIVKAYLAKDTKLDRLVVLKLLEKSQAKSPQMYQRFQREVGLCAALNSERSVQILDFGTTPEGFPFYVMEHLKGESLARLLQRQQRLSIEHAIEIVRQVCAGLQLAHAGVVFQGKWVRIGHPHLQPHDIFLVSIASGVSVKILDFGIAKKIRDSFSFVAPEIDGRADIYSLGIIFYKMLSGTDPFNLGCQKHPGCDRAGAKARTSQLPQPLRSQPGCEQISPQLEAVVLKCLQKPPEACFATIAQLQQALEMALAASPTDFTSTSSSNTTMQSPLPATNSDSSTVPRQAIPLAESPLVQPCTIAQISTGATPSSPDRTIYQDTVSPASSSPDRTIYQNVATPRHEQPARTIYPGVSSPRQSDADRTIYQRQPLLLRLQRIPRQSWRATLSTTCSLTRVVKRLVRRIELWIRRHQLRF